MMCDNDTIVSNFMRIQVDGIGRKGMPLKTWIEVVS